VVAIAGLYSSLQPVNTGFWNDFSASLFWVAGSIVMFSIMAGINKLDRFYIYGLLVATPFPFRLFMKKIFFDISTVMFFVVSIIILSWGTVTLLRFIKNTPKPGRL
jgi:hypothetical protein